MHHMFRAYSKLSQYDKKRLMKKYIDKNYKVMIKRQFANEYDISGCQLDELDDILCVFTEKKKDELLARYINENKDDILGLSFFKDYDPYKFHRNRLRQIDRLLVKHKINKDVSGICFEYLKPDGLKQLIVMIDLVSNFYLCGNDFSLTNYVMCIYENKVVFKHVKSYVGGKYIRDYINVNTLVKKIRNICKKRMYNFLTITYSLEKNKTLDALNFTIFVKDNISSEDIEGIREHFSDSFADVDVVRSKNIPDKI
jgi:hypothetical protein